MDEPTRPEPDKGELGSGGRFALEDAAKAVRKFMGENCGAIAGEVFECC
jgi:hypothetical protein